MFCALFLKIALSVAELISFFHLGDLTPLGYYLFGALKDKCFADKPEKIDALKDNIHEIDNVLENWSDRVGCCMASRGSHMNEIIFPLFTGRIVLSNKKNLRKYSVVFFKAFSKNKKLFGGPIIIS